MKPNFKYILPVFVLFLVYACEKVIDIPLVESERRIVIEGQLRDQVGNNHILISKTGSMYDDTGFDQISGAIVTVTDEDGTIYTFPEVDSIPGMYWNPSFVVEPNNSYSLMALVEGETITSTCNTMSTPTLDGLLYTVEENPFAGFFGGDSLIQVFYQFSDFATQRNFYQIKGWVNDTLIDIAYLFDDQYYTGNITAPLWQAEINKGDTVHVELISMDQANYEYLYTLDSSNDEGGFSAAPANPRSNLEGNALGYFGAFTTDTLSIIIPE